MHLRRCRHWPTKARPGSRHRSSRGVDRLGLIQTGCRSARFRRSALYSPRSAGLDMKKSARRSPAGFGTFSSTSSRTPIHCRSRSSGGFAASLGERQRGSPRSDASSESPVSSWRSQTGDLPISRRGRERLHRRPHNLGGLRGDLSSHTLATRAPSMANRLADGCWTFRYGHEPDGIVEAMDADTPKCEICGRQKRAAAS